MTIVSPRLVSYHGNEILFYTLLLLRPRHAAAHTQEGEEAEGEMGAVADGGLNAADATGLQTEGGVSIPTEQGADGIIPSPSTTSTEGFQQDALTGVSSTSASSGGSPVAAAQDKKGEGGVVAAWEAVRGVVSENKEVAAVAIAGAAGATVVVSRSSGGRNSRQAIGLVFHRY